MIKKNYSQLTEGIFLIIRFGDDVLTYLDSQEFKNNVIKQENLLRKRVQIFTGLTVMLVYKDANSFTKWKNGHIVSMWTLLGDKYSLIEPVEYVDHCDEFQYLFAQVIMYYLLNPYIILDPNTGNTTKTVNKKYISSGCKMINLTANHHKHKIKRGINVLDIVNDSVHPSITFVAKTLNVDYNMFWRDLKNGREKNYQRIERLIIKQPGESKQAVATS
jgi:hypothetical protein